LVFTGDAPSSSSGAFCAQYRDYGCCDAAAELVAEATFESLRGGCTANKETSRWCRDQLNLLLCAVCSPAATFDSPSLQSICPRFATKIYTACLFDEVEWGPDKQCKRVADMFYTKEQFINALNLKVAADNGNCFSAATGLRWSPVVSGLALLFIAALFFIV
jgi:hypothetical protein